MERDREKMVAAARKAWDAGNSKFSHRVSHMTHTVQLSTSKYNLNYCITLTIGKIPLGNMQNYK